VKVVVFFGGDDITPVPDENWYNDYAAEQKLWNIAFMRKFETRIS